MKFLVLGTVEARDGGRPTPLGRRRERFVLGMLALNAGRAVSVERLAWAAWEGAEPPETARNAIKVSISRLRKALAPTGASIATRGDAYVLDVRRSAVDAWQFRTAVTAALNLGDSSTRARALRQALALWRGELMEDVAPPGVRTLIAADLLELRLAAQQHCIEADIESGRRQEAVAELRGLLSAYPTHEGFVALLMTSLERLGRPAEALDAYAELSRVLADDLGVDPGPDLSRLHTRILRQDSAHAHPRLAIRTLPRDIPAFTGRNAELIALDRAVARAGPAPLVVITGSGGVGKTALAVHWAHRADSLFRDGQLFVNLRGYGPRVALSSHEALTHLLLALGVPLASIPPAADDAASMYRARISGKRLLIVVDNASSADAVRPLLPGASGCGVLVTSRDMLTGLTAGEGASRVALRRLSAEHSIAILRNVIGDDRVAEESSAAFDLVARCGGLPLALRIAAANLAARPEVTIGSYVRQMDDAGVLDTLQIDDDLTMGVRATLSSSKETLSAVAARLSGLLGVPAGADFTVEVCSALMGADATDALRELHRAHLVEQHADGRYGLHDLVRAYVVELAGGPDTEAARDRLLDYLLYSAINAAETAYSHRRYIHEAPPGGASAQTFDSPRDALAWLDAEVGNLVAEAERASRTRPLRFAWTVCDCLAGYFWIRRHAALWSATIEAAERACVAADARQAALSVRSRRGMMHLAYSEYEAAEVVFTKLTEESRDVGDLGHEATAFGNLGSIMRELGRLSESREHSSRALEMNLEMGRRQAAGSNLISLAAVVGDMSDVAASVEFARRAEKIYREINHPEGVAAALLTVAEVQVHSGAGHQDVQSALGEAARIYDEIGAASGQAMLLVIASRAKLNDGLTTAALDLAERALAIAADIESPGMRLDGLIVRGDARWAIGDRVGARQDYVAAEQEGRTLGTRPAAARALIAQAEMALEDGDASHALTYAEQALATADRPRDIDAAKRLIEAIAISS